MIRFKNTSLYQYKSFSISYKGLNFMFLSSSSSKAKIHSLSFHLPKVTFDQFSESDSSMEKHFVCVCLNLFLKKCKVDGIGKTNRFLFCLIFFTCLKTFLKCLSNKSCQYSRWKTRTTNLWSGKYQCTYSIISCRTPIFL